MSVPQAPVAIPKEFNCQPDPGLPTGIQRSTLVILPISQINSSVGSVISIRTPVMPNAWMDPQSIRFRVNATFTGTCASGYTPSTTTGAWLLSAFPGLAMFSRFTVQWASSMTLEDLLTPALIAHFYTKVNQSGSESQGSSPSGGANQNYPLSNLGVQLCGVNAEAATVTTTTWTQTVDMTFQVPGLMGPATQKFLPLFVSDYLASFYVESVGNYVCGTSGFYVAQPTINNLEMIFDAVQLPPEAQGAVLAASGGQLVISTNQFTQSAFTLGASTAAGTVNFPLNLNRMSAKAVWVLTNTGPVATTGALQDGIYGSIFANYSQGTGLILNGSIIPQNGLAPDTKTAELFASIHACQRSLSSITHNGGITKDAFYRSSTATGRLIAYNAASTGASATVTTSPNSALLVVDTSRYPRPSIFLSGSQMGYSSQLQLVIGSQLAAYTHNVVVYTEFDCIFVVNLATRQASRII